jgi:hypothetical protein
MGLYLLIYWSSSAKLSVFLLTDLLSSQILVIIPTIFS